MDMTETPAPRIDRLVLTFGPARRVYEPHEGDVKVVKGRKYLRVCSMATDFAGNVLGYRVHRNGKQVYDWILFDENDPKHAKLEAQRISLYGKQRPWGKRRKPAPKTSESSWVEAHVRGSPPRPAA